MKKPNPYLRKLTQAYLGQKVDPSDIPEKRRLFSAGWLQRLLGKDKISQKVDIEELRALEMENYLLYHMIELIPDSVFVKDIDCRKVLTNRVDMKIMGVAAADDALGKTDYDVYPQEIADRFYADDQSVLKTGTPLISKDEMVDHQMKGRTWISSSKIPLRSEVGEIIGIIGISRNVTDRLLAERALKKNEERLKAIVDSNPTGILITDEKGVVVQVNAAFLKIASLVNLSEQDIVNNINLEELAGLFSLDAEYAWKHYLREGRAFNVEISIALEENKKAFLALLAVSLKNELGEAEGWLLNVQDLTEYKRAQELATELRNLAEARAYEAEKLRRAGAAVASSLELKDTIDCILEQLMWVVPCDSGSIQIVRNGEMEVVGARGHENSQSFLGRRFSLKDNHSLNTLVYTQKKPIIFSNISKDFPDFRHYENRAIQSFLAVPLIVQKKVIGMLTLDSCQENFFNAQHVESVTAFAQQVAIAWENSRLYSETQRSLLEQSILNHISRSTSNSLKLHEYMEVVYQQINRHIRVPGFSAVRYDSATSEWFYVYQRNNLSAEERRHPLSEGVISLVIQTMEPLRLNSFQEIESFTKTSGRNFFTDRPLSWMGVPMVVSEHVVGAIIAKNFDQEYAFNDEEFAFFCTVGAQIAPAFENMHLFEKISEMAVTDALTGIFNRRQIVNTGEQEIARSNRYGKPLSVIMLDIDHFKRVNDTYGHGVGDRVLRHVAQVCRHQLRKADTVGRYGGEEFVVVLPETESGDAWRVAERIRQAIEDCVMEEASGGVCVTASLGVATMELNETLESLFQRVDMALYKAKQAGRNRVTIFSESKPGSVR